LDAEQRRRDNPEETTHLSMSQALKVERTTRKNKPDVNTSNSS
jgi:hypothetical protein